MKRVHYYAAWTDSGCLLGCDHEHQTVASAVACINQPGGYVLAVETRLVAVEARERALNEEEEAQFQQAMYGIRKEAQIDEPPEGALGWLPAK